LSAEADSLSSGRIAQEASLQNAWYEMNGLQQLVGSARSRFPSMDGDSDDGGTSGIVATKAAQMVKLLAGLVQGTERVASRFKMKIHKESEKAQAFSSQVDQALQAEPLQQLLEIDDAAALASSSARKNAIVERSMEDLEAKTKEFEETMDDALAKAAGKAGGMGSAAPGDMTAWRTRSQRSVNRLQILRRTAGTCTAQAWAPQNPRVAPAPSAS